MQKEDIKRKRTQMKFKKITGKIERKRKKRRGVTTRERENEREGEEPTSGAQIVKYEIVLQQVLSENVINI